MSANLLSIKNLAKSYNAYEVLADINFELKDGEIVAFIGSSGSGKTTLFNIIAGLLDRDVGELTLKEGLRLACVFQEPRLLPWKSVEDNLTFVQQNFLTEKEGAALREYLLKGVGLIDFRDSFPGELSGGMKQRLEFARALSIKPDLLLLDEPFKSIDTGLKIKLRELLLKNWQEEAYSILLITHDPREAVLLADRICFLAGQPAGIEKEFKIRIPQGERGLADKGIYSILQEIADLYLMD
ncbi:ATP-binding cassette domain-containing protein [Iocasia frigidifontis]|uniref:ATP-binding cassette domain-containing protein n=1 Tax=Iocasia fonsfrigidae TaxID=2682810 RepID=A0A8A7KCX1_9FIRM|nr:ABC transporter ATP-binding protein [Iocasia fonsfrigidae]QTL99636.1 ATP-binding cassette domain-containing protein [Iocasia fonsfrigidae]